MAEIGANSNNSAWNDEKQSNPKGEGAHGVILG
jgi:hypothetical protein